jgi:hypothetical protein
MAPRRARRGRWCAARRRRAGNLAPLGLSVSRGDRYPGLHPGLSNMTHFGVGRPSAATVGRLWRQGGLIIGLISRVFGWQLDSA